MNKTVKGAFYKIEHTFLGRLARHGYFSLLKIQESVNYAISRKLQQAVVVMTFDDFPEKSSMKIPEFLAENGISATFFVPASAEDALLKRISALGHELGGHGWSHENDDRIENYKDSSVKAFKKLAKFDKHVASWRFPWLSYNEESLVNVRNAGFLLDSSVGGFFAQNSVRSMGPLWELKFLRFPTPYGMDLDGDYRLIKSCIISRARQRGVVVLPFHLREQAAHFDEFCDVVQILKCMNVRFMNLRNAYTLLK